MPRGENVWSPAESNRHRYILVHGPLTHTGREYRQTILQGCQYFKATDHRRRVRTYHLPCRHSLLLQESLRTRHMLTILHEGRVGWIQGLPHLHGLLTLHLPLLLDHMVALHQPIQARLLCLLRHKVSIQTGTYDL